MPLKNAAVEIVPVGLRQAVRGLWPSRNYYMLMVSLPNLPSWFQVERVPISRTRLQDRLRMLHPQDAAVLEQVIDFLAWDRQPLDRTDDDFIAHYYKLMAHVENPLVRRLIDDRINVRTIVSALRLRRRRREPPRGVGDCVASIRRYWQHPTFNLQGRFSWIESMAKLLADEQSLAGDELLLSVIWRRWSELAQHYTFSFEAVILYLARWEIIDRWTTRDPAAGQQRFEHLLAETIGEHATLE
jgi:hypothetical protein